MPNTPSTFCPAKWDELNINLNYNYVYACCKSTPVKFVKNISEVLQPQKENLLKGIQDSSCSFCWKNENLGLPSLRLSHLAKFDSTVFPRYVEDTVLPKSIEINLGNECNFQCTYCSPKFSSKWESDIRNKPYNFTTDNSMYEIVQKESDNVHNTIEWLSKQNGVESLIIIGGEPLLNKNLFKILDNTHFDNIAIVTNLSCDTKTLDKVFARASNFKKMFLNISLDSTGGNAELSRYGLCYETITHNISYALAHAPDNVECKILSLMTSITIRDIKKFAEYIQCLHEQKNTLTWELHVCRYPQIQSMATLPDPLKPLILETLATLVDKEYVSHANIVESVVKNTSFDLSLYNELSRFLEEFCARHNIDITTVLTE